MLMFCVLKKMSNLRGKKSSFFFAKKNISKFEIELYLAVFVEITNPKNPNKPEDEISLMEPSLVKAAEPWWWDSS